MTGRVFSINVSKVKGTPKDMVGSCEAIEGFGIEGDAHAGGGERQVSLLSIEAIEKIKKEVGPGKVELGPGVFAENITIEGIDLSDLRAGDKLKIGDGVILKITAIGKTCRRACSITQVIGRCIMPKQGIFAGVEKGGPIRVHDKVALEKRQG